MRPIRQNSYFLTALMRMHKVSKSGIELLNSYDKKYPGAIEEAYVRFIDEAQNSGNETAGPDSAETMLDFFSSSEFFEEPDPVTNETNFIWDATQTFDIFLKWDGQAWVEYD